MIALIINPADKFKFITESSICQMVLFPAALYDIDQSEHFYGHEYDELVYDDSHVGMTGTKHCSWHTSGAYPGILAINRYMYVRYMIYVCQIYVC